MSGLVDLITGGENERAAGDLANALASVQAIHTPDTQELQLGPLEQFAMTGDLAPALAEAAQAGPSAFDSENLSGVPMATMQQALSKEKEIADANGMTPQEQAAIAQAEQDVNRNVAGQRGAIAQEFAGRGVPASLIAAALEQGAMDNTSQQAYQNALQARAGAAQQGITALANEGNLAHTMYQDEAGQANTIAAAQNALNEFNAANTQQTNLANQGTRQAANVYNTTTKQTLSNQNVNNENERRYQNQVEAPQQAASLALQKGSEEAGVGEAQAQQATAAGQQAAGLFSGLLGAGATMGASALAKPTTVNLGGVPTGHADGGEIQPEIPPTAFSHGGYLDFRAGGPVPGQARVAGDSEQNDVVPARLSPGEVVIPRSVVANPKTLPGFLAAKAPTMVRNMPHPNDLASLMKALAVLRGEAA